MIGQEDAPGRRVIIQLPNEILAIAQASPLYEMPLVVDLARIRIGWLAGYHRTADRRRAAWRQRVVSGQGLFEMCGEVKAEPPLPA